MIETTPRLTRSQLRSLCEDESASPRSRLDAASTLLNVYGASARNLRTVKRVAKQFEKHVAVSERTQRQVRWLAEKLKARIEKALAADTPLPDATDEDDAAVPDEPVAAASHPIGGLALLPPDEPDDPFWDQLVRGRTRRALFCQGWAFPATISRSEMLRALASDPAKIAAHTLELKTWACSRERLDEKFAADRALIALALAERRLDDRDELAKEIIASGIPLYEFTHDHDFNGDGLPVLVRSKAGDLIRAIDFIKTWPEKRAAHRPV